MFGSATFAYNHIIVDNTNVLLVLPLFTPSRRGVPLAFIWSRVRKQRKYRKHITRIETLLLVQFWSPPTSERTSAGNETV